LKQAIMDPSALVSHFDMSPEEERQFRLNLENKTYSAVVFDEVTYSSLLKQVNGFRERTKWLLTRKIKGARENLLWGVMNNPNVDALIALAVVAGEDPNYRLCPLGHAIRTGSLNLVSILLDLGADPNFLPDFPGDFLSVAIRKGFYDVMELLVRRGMRVNRVISYTTPLGVAVSVGDCQFTNFFLDHGADPNFFREEHFVPQTPLVFQTPLMNAIRSQDRTCLDLLLQRGADPNMYEKKKSDSPFMMALRCEDLSFAQTMLLYGADWRTCDPRAVSQLPYEKFEWFVENSGYAPNVPAPEGLSLLELVTALGDEDKIKLLVVRGALSAV